MKNRLFLSAVALTAVAASAHASTVIQIDVNSLTAVAFGDKFDTSFTGSLTLSKDSSSNLAAVLRNGVGVGVGFGGPYSGDSLMFSATFNFVAGSIAGMGLNVGVDASGGSVIDNTYMATVTPGFGNILVDPGKPGHFIVAAQTHNGVFNDLTFGGVDVSDFFGNLAHGNFINFVLDGSMLNSATRTDTNVDIDVFAIIPLPTPLGMATVGLLGLAAIRRRRA